jgi:hypothetical protein
MEVPEQSSTETTKPGKSLVFTTGFGGITTKHGSVLAESILDEGGVNGEKPSLTLRNREDNAVVESRLRPVRRKANNPPEQSPEGAGKEGV